MAACISLTLLHPVKINAYYSDLPNDWQQDTGCRNAYNKAIELSVQGKTCVLYKGKSWIPEFENCYCLAVSNDTTLFVNRQSTGIFFYDAGNSSTALNVDYYLYSYSGELTEYLNTNSGYTRMFDSSE